MILVKYDQSLTIFCEQKLFSDINKEKIVYQIGAGKLLITHLDGNVITKDILHNIISI